MVKALAFKGDKKTKKRRAPSAADGVHLPKKVRDSPTDVQEDDSWVTADASEDINGPVIIVLPSIPLSCIACDAEGKVFVSVLDNMMEQDPTEAEPHDVRQVWIAIKIPGTNNIGLKGHHGRFLTCDNTGTLFARSEAMSPEETFTCIETPDTPGTFSIQTQRDRFLSIPDDGNEVRGDEESISFNTTVRVRMQARFKSKVKASKEMRAKEKITRKELEDAVGRKLDDDEVRRLKKARMEGDYHEALLLIKVKGKHDKYS